MQRKLLIILISLLCLFNITYSKVEANSKYKIYRITAYDLSYYSCGKHIYSRGYGQTKTGLSVKNKTWKSARVVAVNPRVIPLGSIIKMEFTDKRYKKYNGLYKAADTGAFSKNTIDFFLADFKREGRHPATKNFGVTHAKVTIVKLGKKYK